MKVLSLSFTSNREDMFDVDSSSLTRVAIVLINLIERIAILIKTSRRDDTSLWFYYCYKIIDIRIHSAL